MEHQKGLNMVSSPPGSPEAARQVRAQSMYSAPSPDSLNKQRPQSMFGKLPPRSQSRMSQSSNHVGSKASDEDAKISVKVGESIFAP